MILSFAWSVKYPSGGGGAERAALLPKQSQVLNLGFPTWRESLYREIKGVDLVPSTHPSFPEAFRLRSFPLLPLHISAVVVVGFL